MGKASQRKKERRENKMSSSARKVYKQLIKESKPELFVVDGKEIYFNPLKKLLEGEAYKTVDGKAVTKEMVQKYERFLKIRFAQEQLAKKSGVDIDKEDK